MSVKQENYSLPYEPQGLGYFDPTRFVAEPVDDVITYVNDAVLPETKEEPFYSHCARGFRYRQPYFVTGSCVKNRAGVKYNTPEGDQRCPANMHWRNTFYIRGKCVRLIEKKLKGQVKPRTELPECDKTLIEPLFQEHLKVIRSLLQEMFTVPISKEKLVHSSLLAKVKSKFIQSLKSVTNQKKCTIKLSADEIEVIKDVIKQEVYAFNQDFITEEQWQLVKETAELDMLLHVCKKVVKAKPDSFKLTFAVDEGLNDLRRNLVYLEEHHLLPKQNLLIAKIVQQYVGLYETRESLHVMPGEQINMPSRDVQEINSSYLINEAVRKGFLETSRYVPERDNALPPEFVIPTPEELEAYLGASEAELMPVQVKEEPLF